MDDKAAHLRQMVTESGRRPGILAVASGKGGVGKSNIATNLSVSLAAAGHKVLLVDADISLGNVDLLMNINPRYNISHILAGRKSIEDVVHVGPEGLEIICGASGLVELANLNKFQQNMLMHQLKRLQEGKDIVIADTGAGISESVIAFCLAADNVLVVTTPEATAMTDAYAMIKVLVRNNLRGRISLVVNKADSIAQGKKVYRQISSVASRFLETPIYDAGVLLRDERLVNAVRQRKPVVMAYPNAPITKSLTALAARLIKNSAPLDFDEQSFFKKVVDWFF